jgi:hypothetical protein
MKMIQHGLGPGMKHTYEPGLALKPPLGITGEYFDHLTDRRKQQVQQRSHIGDVKIFGGCSYGAMTHQAFDFNGTRPVFQKMRGKAMPIMGSSP